MSTVPSPFVPGSKRPSGAGVARPLAAIVAAVLALTGRDALAAGDYRQYKPPKLENAENHLRVPFLPESRDWERMDLYVPKDAKEPKLPCIVFIYGGGWGGKVTWGKENFTALLDNGYVVAMPDYVLGAQQPAPMAVWDGAAAIRFLRANAATYRIDPERLGVMGLSAGGWLAQYLAPSDSATLWTAAGKNEQGGCFPMLEPHPANGGFSPLPVAFVTDWGAGFLAKDLVNQGRPWLGPNDPPLFTCVTIPEGTLTKGVKAYRDAGAVTEIAYTYGKGKDGEPVAGKNPNDYGHCLVGVAVKNAWTKDPKTGAEITFGDRTLQFLDQYVKNPKTATSPMIAPHGGPVAKPVAVVLSTIHPGAAIHYTLDGTDPTGQSPAYRQPVEAKPGVTLKAVAIKPGLKPSPVATAVFLPAPCAPPVITTTQPVYRAKIKEPFSVTFQATSDRPVTWRLSGKIEAKALEAVDVNKDSSGIKREGPWLSLDAKTGVLSGTPKGPGVSVFIVAANVTEGKTVLCDARSVIVVAE
jgi:dienelactone hydrolase